MKSTQKKDIFRQHAIEAMQELTTKQWKIFEISWSVDTKKGKAKPFSGVGKQEATTPVELTIDLLRNLDMRGKDTLIFSNYDLFVIIKFLRMHPEMLPHLGLDIEHVNYKTITLLTDSKKLHEAPTEQSWIEPSELVYVENLFDVATIEETLNNHTR